MNERTTIGGTVYESIGSSSSNLLLKCNGTARIQWGNKLIDLIKNGKINSENSLELIFIINDESEINSEGIYVLNNEENLELLIYKDGNKYNFTETDLYIKTNKLNLTVELKKQALDNIGLYYATLAELQNSGILDGFVYVIENKNFYTIQNGVIEEFLAKTITVEKEKSNINGFEKIVLSVSDDEYLVLSDLKIIANHTIYVKETEQICSENADEYQGYRLYMNGGMSYLDVDYINVRNKTTQTEESSSNFSRGMIIMYSGIEEIPEGWAICDGNEYEWNGIKTQTPNLIGRFIKAVAAVEDVKETDIYENNELMLSLDHLPEHSHEISNSVIENSINAGTEESIIISGYNISLESSSTGNIVRTTEQTSIKIEPNYYSLIFIVKL